MRVTSMKFKIFALLFISFISIEARIFFIGSNQYYSWFTFPQDILRFHGNFIYYYPSYQKSPWWGDIDEPNRKPNPTYTSTEEKVKYSNSTFFNHEGKTRRVSNRAGLYYGLRENLVSLIDVEYALGILKNTSEGNFTNQDDNSYIPYEYSLGNTINEIFLTSVLGFPIRSIPIGIKFGFGFEQTGLPDSEIKFTKSGTPYISSRMLWGWSRTGCNHIFGPRGTEGDAWFQNEYSCGPLFRFDIQGGATLPKVKLGTRFRYITGLQDQYAWVGSAFTTPDTIVGSRFIGNYIKSEWSKKSRDAMIRLYGNIFWKKHERYSLNTLVFLQYEGKTAFNALSDNLEVEDDAKQKMRNFIVEINPNMNVFPGSKSSYIDIGLLLEYSFTRFENTYNRYINGGGEKEAFINTPVNIDAMEAEYYWERFSYANENFFDAGLDISTMFPLYGDAHKRLGLGFVLFANTKITWLNKYFGSNPANNADGDFSVAGLRKNYKHEIWFNSMMILYWAFSRYNFRLEVTEPLLYSLSPRTRVTDATGEVVKYEHSVKGTWSSINSVRIGLFVSYDL